MRRWLKLDAQNRAFRTMLQGVLAVIVLPALDAVFQAVVMAVSTAEQPFDLRRTLGLAATSAMTAAVMAVAAYVHRLKVDLSAVPSAEPPRPMGVTAAQAPATTPVEPIAR